MIYETDRGFKSGENQDNTERVRILPKENDLILDLADQSYHTSFYTEILTSEDESLIDKVYVPECGRTRNFSPERQLSSKHLLRNKKTTFFKKPAVEGNQVEPY